MVSSDDHCQEVVGLCREKTYAGLVGCSGEYLVFQPPRYFSSSQLKLTYRVSIYKRQAYIVKYLLALIIIPFNLYNFLFFFLVFLGNQRIYGT